LKKKGGEVKREGRKKTVLPYKLKTISKEEGRKKKTGGDQIVSLRSQPKQKKGNAQKER